MSREVFENYDDITVGQLSFWLHLQIFQKLDILSSTAASLLLAQPQKRKCLASWRYWWWFYSDSEVCVPGSTGWTQPNVCVLCSLYMNHRWRYNELNVDAIEKEPNKLQEMADQPPEKMLYLFYPHLQKLFQFNYHRWKEVKRTVISSHLFLFFAHFMLRYTVCIVKQTDQWAEGTE